MINLNTFYQQSSLDKREIDLIVCHVLNINTAKLMIYNDQLNTVQSDLIHKLLSQREKGLPFAYIVGSKQFWDLELKVNQHTLIPRPETELLVELILKKTDTNFSGSILDLGTGSGAIALSLAKHRKHASITAVDCSQECINIALDNKAKYALDNVTIVKSNWFEELEDSYDYIVSNPPYIDKEDNHLKELSFEPITALTADNKGLADIEHIIANAKNHLKPSASLYLEHGYNQHQLTHQIFRDNGYSEIKTYHDLALIPRVTMAKRL